MPVEPTYPPQPLSETAKGKRPARDDGDENDEDYGATGSTSRASSVEPPAPLAQRPLTIRFTEGVEDLEITVSEKETVRDVKKKIVLERPTLQNRRLRLIHAGRLLTDGTYLYIWLASLEERQKRAKAIEGTDDPVETTANPNTGSNAAWLHCSIGAEETEAETEASTQAKEEAMTEAPEPLRGFDRLQTAGFTEEDIETIRRQFRISRGLDDGPATLEDEDPDDEHARALEEQWIDDLDGAAGPVEGFDNADELYSTLLQGVMTGFFFNLIPFFFMRSSRPAAFFSDSYEQIEHTPSVVYSKRMQMALVIGLMVNLLIGILRYVS